MKTAIVTGASGFIGCALVEELLQHNYQVYAVRRKASCDRTPQDKNVETVACDMHDIGGLVNLLPKREYDFFFHLAWKDMGGPNRNSATQQLQNTQWTVDALQAASKLNCRRFVGAGSMMEQQMLANTYADGEHSGNGDVYGAAKLSAHVMSKALARKYGLEWVWPVLANAYGIGQSGPWLVNTTIKKCIDGEVPEFTAGNQICDLVYIDDVARAFRLIAERGKPFCEYLIGSSQARPLREFLLEMQAAIAPDIEFRFGELPFTGANLPLSVFDCTSTERDTGFRAQVSFAEGCRRTMEWLKTQKT